MLVKTGVLLCAIAAGLGASSASATQIFVNNMSDAAVQLTAYDAATPAKKMATWCVETGAFERHELKVEPARLEANVMKKDECKEPLLLNRTLDLPKGALGSTAALYRVTGTGGKYSLSGPLSHKIEK